MYLYINLLCDAYCLIWKLILVIKIERGKHVCLGHSYHGKWNCLVNWWQWHLYTMQIYCHSIIFNIVEICRYVLLVLTLHTHAKVIGEERESPVIIPMECLRVSQGSLLSMTVHLSAKALLVELSFFWMWKHSSDHINNTQLLSAKRFARGIARL